MKQKNTGTCLLRDRFPDEALNNASTKLKHLLGCNVNKGPDCNMFCCVKTCWKDCLGNDSAVALNGVHSIECPESVTAFDIYCRDSLVVRL